MATVYTTTIVTAYYELPNSTPSDAYLKAGIRLMKVNQPMVVYCEEKTVPFITEHRGDRKTHIVALPYNQIIMYKYLDTIKANREKYWPTRHSRCESEVHALVLSKADFILRTMEINPFNTIYFAWSDFSLLGKKPHGSDNYTNDSVYEKLDKICNNPRPRFTIELINCWNNEDKKDMRNFFAEYRWTCAGCFYTTDIAAGKIICQKIIDKSIEITLAGYGHSEEMMISYVIDEYEQYFNFYVGDYQDTIDNYYKIRGNYAYVNKILKIYENRNPDRLKKIMKDIHVYD